MQKTQARQNLISAIRLVERAVKTVDYYNRVLSRDVREPGRKEKMDAEERLTRIFRRAFRKQEDTMTAWLETQSIKRKYDIPDLDFDEDDIADLIRELLNAIKHGILLFGTGKPVIDYTLTNAEAAKWAAEYAYELVKGITSTTMDTLQTLISAFVETPGMTIGDVVSQLPFSLERSQRIAVTEITRTYAQGEMMAGEALRKEFPDVKIVKTWYTNVDDLVCTEICEPLNGEERELDDEFSEGIKAPPAHPNCRCWIETSTALAELD